MPSVTHLRERVRGWLQRAPKVITPRSILIVDGNSDTAENFSFVSGLAHAVNTTALTFNTPLATAQSSRCRATRSF